MKKWITLLFVLFLLSCKSGKSVDYSIYNVKFIAHRGYSSQYVDNTKTSFIEAGKRSFYGIETDVRLTKDHVFVCYHDSSITYNKESFSINDSNFKTLQNIPLENQETICTLDEYLSICNQYQKHAFVELKEAFSEDELKEIIEKVETYHQISLATFISFSLSTLQTLQTINDTCSVQLLLSNPLGYQDGIINNLSSSFHYFILSNKAIQKYHDKGLEVGVWTINDIRSARQFAVLGVDYITTNWIESL